MKSTIKIQESSPAQWHSPVVPIFSMLRQEDHLIAEILFPLWWEPMLITSEYVIKKR